MILALFRCKTMKSCPPLPRSSCEELGSVTCLAHIALSSRCVPGVDLCQKHLGQQQASTWGFDKGHAGYNDAKPGGAEVGMPLSGAQPLAAL